MSYEYGLRVMAYEEPARAMGNQKLDTLDKAVAGMPRNKYLWLLRFGMGSLALGLFMISPPTFIFSSNYV